MKRPTFAHCVPAALAAVLGAPRAALADYPANFIDQNFETRTFKDAAQHVLPYRLFKPAGYGGTGKNLPVVIFFHGAGERGNDNQSQLTGAGGPSYVFVDPAQQATWPSFVVAPQCPSADQWVAVPWGDTSEVQPATPTWELAASMALLDALAAEFGSIDPSRQYITGLSMGGYATWDAVTRWPQRFAKAVPICGGGDEAKVSPIVNLPIWAFNSSDDGTVPAVRSEHMVAAIEALGGAPLYTEYCTNGLGCYGHGSWGPAYGEPGLLPWLYDDVVPGAIACKSSLAGHDGTGGACAAPRPDGGRKDSGIGAGTGSGGTARVDGGGAGAARVDAGASGTKQGTGGAGGSTANDADAASDVSGDGQDPPASGCGCRLATDDASLGVAAFVGLALVFARRRRGARAELRDA